LGLDPSENMQAVMAGSGPTRLIEP
jgi:hypothetical protein